MILPFSMMDFAEAKKADKLDEQYSAEAVTNAFAALTPYMIITDENKVIFDAKQAKHDGLDKKAIKMGKEYTKMQNMVMKSISDDPKKQAKLDKKISKKFAKFFDKLKNDKDFKLGVLELLLQPAYAASCNYNGPHPENAQVYTNTNTSSISALKSHLSGLGYHTVAGYASSIQPLNYNGYDHAKGIYAYGCNFDVFREQAVIYDSDTYKYQSLEPNPELSNYSHPVWWWTGYVITWHLP